MSHGTTRLGASPDIDVVVVDTGSMSRRGDDGSEAPCHDRLDVVLSTQLSKTRLTLPLGCACNMTAKWRVDKTRAADGQSQAQLQLNHKLPSLVYCSSQATTDRLSLLWYSG